MTGICLFLSGVYCTVSAYHILFYIKKNKSIKNGIYSLVLLSFVLFLFVRQLYQASSDYSLFTKKIILALDFFSYCFTYLSVFIFICISLKIIIKKWIFLLLFSSLIFLPLIICLSYAFITSNLVLPVDIFNYIGLLLSFSYWVLIIYEFFIKKKYINYKNIYLFSGAIAFYLFFTAYSILRGLHVSKNLEFIIINCGFVLFILFSSYYLVFLLFKNLNYYVTLRQSYIMKLNSLNKKFEHKNKKIRKIRFLIKNYFIKFIHDITMSLSIIRNNLNIILKSSLDVSNNGIIIENIDKIEQKVINIMEFERIYRFGYSLNEKKLLNFSNYIDKKINQLVKTNVRRNFKIIKEIHSKIYLNIDRFSADKLIKIIYNNSIYYLNKITFFKISLKNQNDEIFLEIQHDGIVNDEYKNLFNDLIYQVNQNTNEASEFIYRLLLIRKIVNENNGKFIVNKDESNVLTMILIFPTPGKITEIDKHEEYDDFELNDNNSIDIFDRDKPTILIAANNSDDISYLKKEFNSIFNMFLTNSGKNALKMIKSMPVIPDIIISDVVMDEMDGFSFRNELLRDSLLKSIPFIFLTTDSCEKDKMKGYIKGAIDFIIKPIKINELFGKISSIIDFKKLIRERNLQEFEDKVISILRESRQPNKSDIDFDYKCYELSLTDKEKKIIKLILEGKENKEIADILNLKTGTIKGYTNKIYKKCNVGNRIELIKLFL